MIVDVFPLFVELYQTIIVFRIFLITVLTVLVPGFQVQIYNLSIQSAVVHSTESINEEMH